MVNSGPASRPHHYCLLRLPGKLLSGFVPGFACQDEFCAIYPSQGQEKWAKTGKNREKQGEMAKRPGRKTPARPFELFWP